MTISRLNNSGDLMDGGLPYRMTDQPADGWGWLDERSIVGPYVKKYFRGNGREGQTLNDKYVCFIFPAIEPELGGFPFAPWFQTGWAASAFLADTSYHDGDSQNLGQEFEVIRNGKMDVLLIGAGGCGSGSQHNGANYAGGGGGAGQFVLANGHEFTSDVYKNIVGTPNVIIKTYHDQNPQMRGRAGDSVLLRKKIFAALRANMDYESPQFLDKAGTPVFTAWGGGSGATGAGLTEAERMVVGASGGGMNSISGAPFRDVRGMAIEDGVTGYSGGESAYTNGGAGGGGGFAGPGEGGYRYTEPRVSGTEFPEEGYGENKSSRGGDGGPGVIFNFWGEDQEACAGGGGGCYSGGLGGGLGGQPGRGGKGISNTHTGHGEDAASWGSGGGGAGNSATAGHVSYTSSGGQGIIAIRYKLEELA